MSFPTNPSNGNFHVESDGTYWQYNNGLWTRLLPKKGIRVAYTERQNAYTGSIPDQTINLPIPFPAGVPWIFAWFGRYGSNVVDIGPPAAWFRMSVIPYLNNTQKGSNDQTYLWGDSANPRFGAFFGNQAALNDTAINKIVWSAEYNLPQRQSGDWESFIIDVHLYSVYN